MIFIIEKPFELDEFIDKFINKIWVNLLAARHEHILSKLTGMFDIQNVRIQNISLTFYLNNNLANVFEQHLVLMIKKILNLLVYKI
jgi:glycine cleavage system regulatory protein